MARERGIGTTHEGVEGLNKRADYSEIGIVFDATSAYAHKAHDAALRADGKLVVDLTPAAIGPLTVPPAHMPPHPDATHLHPPPPHAHPPPPTPPAAHPPPTV